MCQPEVKYCQERKNYFFLNIRTSVGTELAGTTDDEIIDNNYSIPQDFNTFNLAQGSSNVFKQRPP